jgi:general L-amino acid transport system substrate-binding protein
MNIWRQSIAAIGLAVMAATPVAADTLAEVKQRGAVRCGVNDDLPGFARKSKDGQWAGLDVDMCRAVAAAVVGDADKVEYVPLSATERFEALKTGRIDLLARNSTWTLSRDLGQGMDFVGTNYYDGQGFLTTAAAGVYSALELDGANVCVQAGTTSLQNVKAYFARHRMKLRLHVFDNTPAALDAYLKGQCSVLTSDQSQLYALRSELQDPKAHTVLPEFISKEPLGPVVREGDSKWADIVQWTLFAMVNAEELEISSSNVDRVAEQASDPAIRRFLGREGASAVELGIGGDWAHRVIKQVGNYAESFERNVGGGSPLKIRRGQNALWRDGGLMFAPPIL